MSSCREIHADLQAHMQGMRSNSVAIAEWHSDKRLACPPKTYR